MGTQHKKRKLGRHTLKYYLTQVHRITEIPKPNESITKMKK